jgi:hypothetical protein
MGKQNVSINVQGTDVSISEINDQDYICLTDMAKSKDDDGRAIDIIKNWLRNRNTIEFLAGWETMHNQNFKVVEIDHFRKQAGLNSFVLNPQTWIERTGAIGIVSKSGKYGGTYAHKDIAFEFGSWLSPIFKLFLIKEFQRLKEIESNQYNLEWNVKRIVSKANYKLHTDAIKTHMIPSLNIVKEKEGLVYASEAELLNLALFGCTSKTWKEQNPTAALEGKNLRDEASINELTVLSNLESINSVLIKQGLAKDIRFDILKQMVKDQLEGLNRIDYVKSFKRLANDTYLDAEKNSLLDKK